MNTLKEYDVLRLIEHNQICYVSSDRVKGSIMATWMKYHPTISKERLFRWIGQLVKQLICIHKCRGNPSYQYVNPYSILISEEGNLCLLDVGSASNQEMIKIAEKKNIRKYFCPSDIENGEINDEETDLYGLGKTIQYMLNFIEVVPRFNKAEERIIQNMVSKCIHLDRRNRFYKISDVQKSLLDFQIR